MISICQYFLIPTDIFLNIINMKPDRISLFARTINSFHENNLLMIAGTIILIFPLIATLGQFLNTGYFQKIAPVLLFYWPGSDMEIKIRLYVWFVTGLIFTSYVAGILYMLKNKTLGRIIMITIILFVCSGVIKSFLTIAFGMHEIGLPDLSGKANSAIFSLWHNPVWEEIVFRGIPLLILLGIEKYVTKKRTLAGIWIYCIVPSLLCGLYHIPGHGLIRFFDTLFLGMGFSWLALEYTFFAPVVMHYIADTMLVLNFSKLPTVQASEIQWLVKYGPSLNTFSSLALLFFIILIPILFISYFRKIRKKEQLQA